MDLKQIDLNLLVVFEAVFRTGSVTAAAIDVGRSQPAVSNCLRRLRGITHDPLFVRSPRGMIPTARANQIVGPVQESLQALHHCLNQSDDFDPARAQHSFRLILTDIGERVYLPPLVECAAVAAPGVRFEIIRSDRAHDAEKLRDGSADLAIGNFANLREGCEQERLFYGNFVCALRPDHATIRRSLTIEQYCNAKHAIVTQQDGTDGMIERTLANIGIRRDIYLRIPHYLAAGPVISATDLIMTIPERLGRIFAESGEARTVALPFQMPRIQIRQYWNKRQNLSGPNLWLRGMIRDLFT